MYIHCRKCGYEEGNKKSEYIIYSCNKCVPYKEIGISETPAIVDKVNLKGYGNVSVARLKAIDSQVMLPDDPKDGKHDYLVGTRLPNGKIIDKAPDFRP